jgi:hypothetical protein
MVENSPNLVSLLSNVLCAVVAGFERRVKQQKKKNNNEKFLH